MDVRGAVALVTGGNGGLGQRICHALARQGVHIGVMYVQSRDQADDVVRGLASRHQIEAAAFGCDITDAAAVSRVVLVQIDDQRPLHRRRVERVAELAANPSGGAVAGTVLEA